MNNPKWFVECMDDGEWFLGLKALSCHVICVSNYPIFVLEGNSEIPWPL